MLRVLRMSASGFRSSTSRFAIRPGATVPTLDSTPSKRAPLLVAIGRTGGGPAHASSPLLEGRVPTRPSAGFRCGSIVAYASAIRFAPFR
jgi:hypothetical protein